MSEVQELEAQEVKQELPIAVRVENQFSIELKKLGITIEDLEEDSKKAKEVFILDVNDKEGYKLADQTRKNLKTKRVNIETAGEYIRDEANKYQKKTIERQKELIALIQGEEKRLQARQKEIDEEKAKAAKELAEKEQNQLLERTSQLTSYGAQFIGNQYILGEVAFSVDTIKTSEPEVFENTILPKYKAIWEAAEAKKKKDAEDLAKMEKMQRSIFDNRWRQLKEVVLKGFYNPELDISTASLTFNSETIYSATEIIDLDEERFSKIRDEHNDLVDKIKEEKEAAEKLSNRSKKRQQKVFSLGAAWNGVSYKHIAGAISKEDVQSLEDAEWDALIETTEKAIIEFKAEADRVAEEKRTKELEAQKKQDLANGRYKSLLNLDFRYPTPDDLGTMDENAYEAIVADAKQRYDNAKQEQIKEQQAEEKRQRELKEAEELAQANDKTKWASVIVKLKAIDIPEMRSGQYRKKALIAKELLEKLLSL